MIEPRFKVIPEVRVLVQGRFIKEFQAWLRGNAIRAKEARTMLQGSAYIGIFSPENAAKIEAWLLENGYEREG